MNDNKTSNTDNQAALNDLIQSIQSKINLSQENNETTVEKQETKSESITDEQEIKSENNNENNQNLNIASMLNNLDISSILSAFNSNSNTNNNDNNSFNLGDIDPNTILRIQKLISNFNKNDPKKDLLRSLKPFLKKSRQDKIGEYITILTVIDALDIFGNKGSD